MSKELFDKYFNLQKQIHDYFGYVEDWKVIPLDDATEFYWTLLPDSVRFAKDELTLIDEKEKFEYYENEIYRQRFLPKHVYRTNDFTMICVDTHVDGNKFLQIFDNAKELTAREE